MTPSAARLTLACVSVFLACAAAQAQQLYRWTDEKGRVHITDTPPPASAKSVATQKPQAGPAADGQVPFELAVAMKDFPVSLYTSPNCKEPCAAARAALNKRAVPFTEVQVWNEETNEQLKKASGGNEVPTLVVGRSVHRGFEAEAYDMLLDSARYPRAGLLPPRAQAAPPPPEGYVPPSERGEPLKAKPVKPAPPEEEAPKGPYAPGAPPQRLTRPVQKK
jgi:glutaredoxin